MSGSSTAAGRAPNTEWNGPDLWLLLAALALLTLGLLMVGSASMPIAVDNLQQPFYYVGRQSLALLLGVTAAFIVALLPLRFWFHSGPWLLGAAMLLLVLVLIPGIGREVNGARRWLDIGGFTLQVSELAKLASLIYLAGYLQRHNAQTEAAGYAYARPPMLGPVIVLVTLLLLLLLEPDYGAAGMLIVITMGMLFVANVSPWRFIALFCLAIVAMGLLAYVAPYRWLRLMCFVDPWGNHLECGYQLTQALIAIGRGGLFGVGVGASIQKLHYLPEAHNDFLFAILAEELGLIGIVSVVVLYAVVVWRCFCISARAERQRQLFSAYLVYGIGLMIGLQALINMGVNMGLLPTKGLTLPLMSYGGSSIIGICLALTLVLRADWELRHGRRHSLRTDGKARRRRGRKRR